jgi:hypothetical protein
MVNAGEPTRATDLRGLVRATEAEIVTLDRLAEAVRDRLIALGPRLYWAAGRLRFTAEPAATVSAPPIAHRIDAVFSQGAVGLSNSCGWYPIP